MDRDQLELSAISGIAYKQTNNQSSTVAELKTRFSNRFRGNRSDKLGYATSIHDYRTPENDPVFPAGADRGQNAPAPPSSSEQTVKHRYST